MIDSARRLEIQARRKEKKGDLYGALINYQAAVAEYSKRFKESLDFDAKKKALNLKKRALKIEAIYYVEDDKPSAFPKNQRKSKARRNLDYEKNFRKPEIPKTTFRDIGGMNYFKEQIYNMIITPLRDQTYSQKRQALGLSSGGSILLHGPQGCGKTFSVEAAAGEARAYFIHRSLAEILDPYVGNTEKNIKAIFEEAKEYSPCIVLLDEIDAIAGRRTKTRSHYAQSQTNQLLTSLSDFDEYIKENNHAAIVIGATNYIWKIDPAVRRRFNRTLFVPQPDIKAIEEIYKVKLKKSKISSNVNLKLLAQASNNFGIYTGKDIENICNIAAELALARNKDNDINSLDPINNRDLEYALYHPNTSVFLDWIKEAKDHIKKNGEGGLGQDLVNLVYEYK